MRKGGGGGKEANVYKVPGVAHGGFLLDLIDYCGFGVGGGVGVVDVHGGDDVEVGFYV